MATRDSDDSMEDYDSDEFEVVQQEEPEYDGEAAQLFGSDSEEDSYDETVALLEEKNRRIIDNEAQIGVDSGLEQEMAAGEAAPFDFPSVEQLEEEQNSGVDLPVIWNRIQEMDQALMNFEALSDYRYSRAEHIGLFKRDLMTYFSYTSFLLDKFFGMLSPHEVLELLEANEKKRPMTVRTNTLKIRRKDLAKLLIDRGVNVKPITWSKVAMQIFSSRVPVGATPEYLAGYYMLQSTSSMAAVQALDPKPKETVLDMCAAPGGKTTYIAQLMKNKGQLIANDVNKVRTKALRANIQRLGISNSVVCNLNGAKMTEKMKGHFDRVLLDAPCTGVGIISRDPLIKHKRGEGDLVRIGTVQRDLILAAIDVTKVGGTILYSTCSILAEENEQVVQYACDKRHIKIVDAGLGELGVPGLRKYKNKKFLSTMELTRRIYPHVYNMDGFYIAKIIKLQDIKDPNSSKNTKTETKSSQNTTSQTKQKKQQPSKNNSTEEVDSTKRTNVKKGKRKRANKRMKDKQAKKQKREIKN